MEAQSGADDDADEEDEEDSDAEDADDDTAADVTGSGRFDEEEDMFVGLDDPQLVRTSHIALHYWLQVLRTYLAFASD